MSKTTMNSLRRLTDPKRIELQRPVKKLQEGLTEAEWKDRVALARSREVIWNNPDIREKEQNRMNDFLE